MARLFPSGIDLAANKIVNVGTPTANSDAATKAYVDGLINGLDWKPSVRVATNVNVTIATPGANIDGVAMVAGETFLAFGQATGAQNGPWVWNGAAVPATRPTWWAAGAVIDEGAVIPIEEGTNADKLAVMTTDTDVTVDTTASAFTIIGVAGATYTAGAGLGESPANTFNVNAGVGIAVGTPTADAVNVDTAVVVRKFTQVLSTSATSYVVNHGLGNQWVMVQVFQNGSPFALVDPDIELTDANNVTIRFTNAPSANTYRVVVQG